MIQKQHISGLFALIMGAVFSIGALLSLIASHGDVSAKTAQEWINGQLASAYESEFDENLFHYQPSKSFWDLKSYALFQEGRDGVVVGDEGWLFTTEEFDYSPSYQKNIDQNIAFMMDVFEDLKSNNIDLFIVPVPSKARLLQDKLGRSDFPSHRKRVYSNLIGTLNKESINHVDLAFHIQTPEEFFLKTDTHWTVAGADLAAQIAVRAIREDINLDWPAYQKEFKTETQKEMTHEGDLMRYAVSGKTAALAGLKPDHIVQNQTFAVDGGADDLFGDQVIDIVLVGTSYSANKEWNFEGALKQHLQADILNMADEGLGPFETMQTYLRSATFKDTPPKLIIWEVPERFLPVQYDLNPLEENNV